MSEEHDATGGESFIATGNLRVTVPLTPAYSSPEVTLRKTSVLVSIPLLPGEQRTTTPALIVGAVPAADNPNLIATLTVWSDYDPATRVLTLISNELVDPDSTHLSTYLQSAKHQTMKLHTYLGEEEPSASEGKWNYRSAGTPDLEPLLQSAVQSANQAIIEAAKAQGFTVIVRTPPPQLSPELEEKLQLVYRNGVFKETFDPAKEYGDEMKVFNIQSTWYGEIYLQANEYYANVIGSTGDPHVAGLSWLELWQRQFGAANYCSSENFHGFPCGEYLVGGHVILGTIAHAEPKGSNNVFIMPICAKHNSNNGVYMAPVRYAAGCALHNYLE